jgi:hypothetical protein
MVSSDCCQGRHLKIGFNLNSSLHRKNRNWSLVICFWATSFLPGALFAQDATTEPEEAPGEQQPAALSPEIKAEIEALRTEIDNLKQHNAERELAELKADAETAITAEPDETENELEAKTFRGGERSLQALNPELSIVGDIFGRFVYQNGEIYSPAGGRTGVFPRVLGLHLQANLDPFSFAKMCIGITPGGVELGEAYITWNAITPWLSLTLGKFHQQFGVINRWHAPGLDQFFYPLVLTEHFGGPLDQTGLSALLTLPPMWADHLELEIQVTNGENGKLFAGEFFSVPSGLVHMRNYWDLNRDTYMEIGLSGIIGVNNTWGQPVETQTPIQIYDQDGNEATFYDAEGNPVPIVYQTATATVNDDDWRRTIVGGADLTINWEPVNQAKYKGFTWRSEFLYAYKEVLDSDLSDAVIKSWGVYSYMQIKPIRNWYFGVRGDLTQPFQMDNEGEYTWGVVPYITWWQSPWVRFRLEYDYIDWADMTGMEPEHRVFLQTTFSVGPHKHERY